MAYNEFAYFYDEFNGEADYDALYAHIHAKLKEHGIHDALAYAPYDADPATDKMNERDFALMVYSEDLARLAEVDGSLYLIRPGSRLDISVEEGLADVADALNKIITPSMKTCVLLDTMAGEGTQVGTSFEQLAAIINALFAVLTILGIVTDPTTAGVGDSAQALTYTEPKRDE